MNVTSAMQELISLRQEIEGLDPLQVVARYQTMDAAPSPYNPLAKIAKFRKEGEVTAKVLASIAEPTLDESQVEKMAARSWVYAGARVLASVDFFASLGITCPIDGSLAIALDTAVSVLSRMGIEDPLEALRSEGMQAKALAASIIRQDLVTTPVLGPAAFVAETREGILRGLKVRREKLSKVERTKGRDSEEYAKALSRVKELEDRLGQ